MELLKDPEKGVFLLLVGPQTAFHQGQRTRFLVALFQVPEQETWQCRHYYVDTFLRN